MEKEGKNWEELVPLPSELGLGGTLKAGTMLAKGKKKEAGGIMVAGDRRTWAHALVPNDVEKKGIRTTIVQSSKKCLNPILQLIFYSLFS